MSKLKVARNVVTSKAGRTLLLGKKHSPHLLFAVGVVGVIGTAVLASKATLQLDEIMDEHDRQTDGVALQLESTRLGDGSYSERMAKKDLAVIKSRTAKDVVWLYTPAIVVGAVSIGALTGSHVIMTKRNSALTAAYATVAQAFAQYRARVTDEYGAEIDKKFMFGSETREIVEDGPNGPEVKSVETFAGASQYAKLFSRETSDSWEPRPEHNFFLLQARQTYANDMLQLKGHVLLNDVYDSLGLERTKAGCVVGWVKNHPDPNVDTHIDFGIFDNPDRFLDFAQGREGAILLDFNVQGVVYDLI